MFTKPSTRITIATAIAAVIGTAGIVGAAATGDDSATPTTVTVDARPSDEPTSAGSTSSTNEPTAADAGGIDTTVDDTTAPVEVQAEPVAVDPADVEEPPAPGEPGVVDGPDPVEPSPPAPEPGPTEFLNPVPKPQPPTPAIPGPTDLLPGNGGDADPTPHDGPSDFRVTPLPGHLGNLSSGLEGCELECVTRAQLIANAFNPGVVLEIEATVPVHAEIEITKTGTNGSQHVNKAGYATEWAIPISQLQADTTYDLELTVIDEEGRSRMFHHQFTTVDIIDGLAGNAQGCALQCITEGSVEKTGHHSTVRLHLETSSPARYDVWVSTSEPGTIDGVPILPLEAKVYENVDPSTSATFDVTGLLPDTTYHVIARAEDDHGVDHRVGTFHTDQAPPVVVTVTFEHIRLTYDGDKSAVNRGEVGFTWGLDGWQTGSRSEEKMHAPKNIDLTSHNTATYLLPAQGWELPWIGVSAAERDWDGLSEFCALGTGVASEPFYSADCDTRFNVARTPGPVTQTDVEALTDCSLFGFTGEEATDKCLFLVAPDHGHEYAQFTSIVRISVD